SFVSALKLVEVGTDDAGQAITSCAIIEVVGEAVAKDEGPKLPHAANLALEQLQTLIAAVGEDFAPSDRTFQNVRTVRAVTTDQWKKAFHAAYLSDNPETTQKAFVRSVLRLHRT